MHTYKGVAAMIEIIGALPQVEIQDVDGVNFLDFVVMLSERDVLCDGLGHSVENTFQVVELCGKLHFHDDNAAFGVLGLDVHTVVLVIPIFLVSFTLQDFFNLDWLSK